MGFAPSNGGPVNFSGPVPNAQPENAQAAHPQQDVGPVSEEKPIQSDSTPAGEGDQAAQEKAEN